MQRSVENALNHIVTLETAGIVAGNSPEANWQQLGRLWSDLPEGAVLVRPDRVVAWRAHKPTDPTTQLSQALRAILR